MNDNVVQFESPSVVKASIEANVEVLEEAIRRIKSGKYGQLQRLALTFNGTKDGDACLWTGSHTVETYADLISGYGDALNHVIDTLVKNCNGDTQKLISEDRNNDPI